MKDRLRSRADEDYDALEDELLTLAQSAMTSKTVTCKSCKRKTTVEIADAAVRLRAIEAIFDRTGAAKATAANRGDDDLFSVAANTDWQAIQKMPTEDLIRLRDFCLARDADLMEEAMQRQRDYDAIRAEYGGSRTVEIALRSSQDENALKRIRDELIKMFPRSRPPPSPPEGAARPATIPRMDTVADLYRRAALIERALDDLDVEEQMPGADLAVIEAEREMRRR